MLQRRFPRFTGALSQLIGSLEVGQSRMRLSDVTELHHITRTLNVPSIMRRGILSNYRVGNLSTRKFGTKSIGEKRSQSYSPSGKVLVDYVHLNINARNSMWFKHLNTVPEDARNHVVFRISPKVLSLPDVYVSCYKSTTSRKKYFPPAEAIKRLDVQRLSALWWIDDLETERQLSTEVIVPERIPPSFIKGVYVARSFLVPQLEKSWPGLHVETNPSLFFADNSQIIQKALHRSERDRSGLFSSTESIDQAERMFRNFMGAEDETTGFRDINNRVQEAEEQVRSLTDPRFTSDEWWDDNPPEDQENSLNDPLDSRGESGFVSVDEDV